MAIDARYGEFWRNRLEYHDWWSFATAFLNARVPLALAAKAREEKADEDFDKLYKYWTDLARTQEGVVGRMGNFAGIATQGATAEAVARRKAAVAEMQEMERNWRAWYEGEVTLTEGDRERAFQYSASATVSPSDRAALDAVHTRSMDAFNREKGNDRWAALNSAAAQVANGLAGIVAGTANEIHKSALADQAVADFFKGIEYGSIKDPTERNAIKQMVRSRVYNELGIPVAVTEAGELSSTGAIARDPDRVRVFEGAHQDPGGPSRVDRVQPEPVAAPSAMVAPPVPVMAAPAPPAVTTTPTTVAPPATTAPVPRAPVAPAPTPSATFVAPTPGATYQPVPGLDQAAPGPLAAQFGAAAANEIARNQAMQDVIAERIRAMEAERKARPDTSGQIALDLFGTRPNPEQERFDRFKAWYAKLTPEQKESFRARATEAKRAKEYGKLGEGGRKEGEEKAATIMGDWSELQKQAGEWSAELAALEADQANRKVAGTEAGQAEIDKFYREKADVIATLPPERRETVWTLWSLPDDKARVQVAGYVAESDKKREAAKAKAEAEDFAVTERAVKKAIEDVSVWEDPARAKAARPPTMDALQAVTPQAEYAARRAEATVAPVAPPATTPAYERPVFIPVDEAPPAVAAPWDAAERMKRYDALKAIDPATADARIKLWEDKQRAKAQEGTNAQP